VRIDGKIQQQQNNTARARRQPLDRCSVIRDAVLHFDMVCAVEP